MSWVVVSVSGDGVPKDIGKKRRAIMETFTSRHTIRIHFREVFMVMNAMPPCMIAYFGGPAVVSVASKNQTLAGEKRNDEVRLVAFFVEK